MSCEINLGWMDGMAGDGDAALRHGEEAIRLAREVGDRLNLAIAQNNLGDALRDLGRLDDAGRRMPLRSRRIATSVTPARSWRSSRTSPCCSRSVPGTLTPSCSWVRRMRSERRSGRRGRALRRRPSSSGSLPPGRRSGTLPRSRRGLPGPARPTQRDRNGPRRTPPGAAPGLTSRRRNVSDRCHVSPLSLRRHSKSTYAGRAR